jgi:hypothetical protein
LTGPQRVLAGTTSVAVRRHAIVTSEIDVSEPCTDHIRSVHGQALLAALALAALWLATALVYALLAQPSATLTTLHTRGTRGLPSVVWAGSRDLARLLHAEPEGSVAHD